MVNLCISNSSDPIASGSESYRKDGDAGSTKSQGDGWEASNIYSLSRQNIEKIKEMGLKEEIIALCCRNFSKLLRKNKNN